MIRLHLRRGLLGESGVQSWDIEPAPGLTLRTLSAAVSDRLPRSVSLAVALNGYEPAPADLDRELETGDEVLLAPITAGGVDILALFVYAIVSSAVSFAINYLVSLLLPGPEPPGVGADRGDDKSPTYAWDGVQTNYGQGLPVPIVYGRHLVGGQVIYTDVQASTENEVVDDRLRVVLALSEGPIAAVGDVDAAELDYLGQIGGDPLPSDIRVNNTLLEQPPALLDPVWNLQLAGWFPTSTAQPSVSDILYIYDGLPSQGGSQRGQAQLVDINATHSGTLNPGMPSDVDLVLLPNAENPRPNWFLVYAPVDPQVSFVAAQIQAAQLVQRQNPAPRSRAWIRPGTLEQNPLPTDPFTGTTTTFSPNEQLDTEGSEHIFTYATTDSVRVVGLTFAFPSGCYALDPAGDVLPYPVQVKVQWRRQGDAAWRTVYDEQNTAVEQFLLAAEPSVGPLFDGFRLRLVRDTDPPARGPLEVRVVRQTPASGTRSVSSLVWRNVTFTQTQSLAYPGVALLGLELAAGARFSGGLPNITVPVSGALVRVWHPTHGFSPRTWDVPASPWDFMAHPPGRNPAWVLLDFLTSRWGLGRFLTDDDLDLPSFRAWAAWCDRDPTPNDPWGEPQFAVDVVIDQPRPAWEWVLRICSAGRAAPIWRNGKLGVVYQYAAAHGDSGGLSVPAKSPTQLLTSGNCEDVQVTWLPKAYRPTAFLFQYLDETNGWTQDVLPVEDPEGQQNDPTALRPETYRAETIQAWGVTRPQQHYRDGIFRHRVQRLVRRELVFKTGRWALAAEVGDLLEFEHEILRPFGDDVPLNMTVAEDATNSASIIVDHPVTVPVGETLEVVIRQEDGAPIRRTIASAVVSEGRTTLGFGAGNEVTVEAGATCVVGLEDKLTEVYEVATITLQRDLKREIRCVQWVPEIHDGVPPGDWAIGNDGTERLAAPPTSTLEDTAQLLDLSVYAERDGSHTIAFAKPPARAQASVRVYVRRSGDDLLPWVLVGETQGSSLRWERFTAGTTYQVSGCVERANGQHELPDLGRQVTFTAEEFPPFRPPAVSNARAIELDDYVLLQWDDLAPKDLRHYEVRLGEQWNAGRPVHRDRANRALLANPPRGGSVQIAARSTSGLYGDPVTLQLPTWSPPNTVEAVTLDDTPTTGTHSSTQWNGAGYLELASGALAGIYTTPELDLTYQAPAFWQVLVQAEEHELATIDELGSLAVGSGELQWRTIDGRPASAGQPGLDWETTIDDADKPIDDLDTDLLVHGPASEVGSHTAVFVESRFYVNGAWTDYAEHQDRTVVASRMQVRLRLFAESARWAPRVSTIELGGHV